MITMKTPRYELIVSLAMLYLCAIPALLAGPLLTVKDTQGRALEIELLSVTDKDVRFKRVDNAKEFTVPISQFDEASQAQVKQQAASLPAVLPPFDIEVVIGKRHDEGSSYYMVDQRISTTVKLKNKSNDAALPPLKGRMIFIGRDQKTEDDFTVLSVQEFKVGIAPAASSESLLEPFVTRYDGDQKGRGNVGGYQYFGYLIVFLNDKDEILFDYTTSGPIRKLVNANRKLLTAMTNYSKGTMLDDKMSVTNKPLRAFSR